MPTVQNNGRNIHYETCGNGTPIVLLHSFLCSGEMWSEQLAPLAQHHKVINIDLRGHGKSDAADRPLDIYDLVSDAVAVLDNEGVESAIWAGLSIGGMIALRAALVAGTRVSGLILLDSDAGAETTFRKIKYQAMVYGARLFGIKPLLPQVARLMFGAYTRNNNPQLVHEWTQQFSAISLVSISNIVMALNHRDSLIAKLGQIKQPTLVIVGDEDRSLPPSRSVEMADKLPKVSLKVIERAGHLSALEQPQAVTAAMLSYLEKLPHNG